MSPGEVKGFAIQAMKRKVLTPEEKTAISLLLDMHEIMMEWAPIMEKITKELENVRNTDSAVGATTDGEAE